KLKISFRVPSNLNDGNATSLQSFDFTIHNFLVLTQSEVCHQHVVLPMESQLIHRTDTSSDLTRGTCYELGLFKLSTIMLVNL
nr:hypothetical protein [Tanacetum cinerariifolium]